MLEKMGWAPGKGLGSQEDGRTNHVAVKLKENTLGLGATKKTIDNWLDNTDAFSSLLADLNSRIEDQGDDGAEEEKKEEGEEEKAVKEKKSKKSKKERRVKEGRVEKKGKKKSKKDEVEKEKKDKKKKKKKSKDAEAKEEEEEKPKVQVQSRLAHRAKFRRNKTVSQYNAVDLNAILGLKS